MMSNYILSEVKTQGRWRLVFLLLLFDAVSAACNLSKRQNHQTNKCHIANKLDWDSFDPDRESLFWSIWILVQWSKVWRCESPFNPNTQLQTRYFSLKSRLSLSCHRSLSRSETTWTAQATTCWAWRGWLKTCWLRSPTSSSPPWRAEASNPTPSHPFTPRTTTPRQTLSEPPPPPTHTHFTVV